MSAEEPRQFTVAEAEALLPELDRLLEAAQTLFARASAPSIQTNGQVQRNGATGGDPGVELQSIVDQIQSQGVIVRDLRTGLIDFPSTRDGQPIYLCWQRGEPLHLEWWHPTSTGIAGRQRL